MIKSIIIFIPSMTSTIIIKVFIIMILFNSSWFNTVICINNTLFLWYITSDIISFTRFSCLYITPRTLWCTNTKNLWCNSTCYKTNNLGARKLIFLISQITITISDILLILQINPVPSKGPFMLLKPVYPVQNKSGVKFNSYSDNTWNNALIKFLPV